MENKEFCRKLIKELIRQEITSLDGFVKVRSQLCRQHKPKIFPSIIQILSYADPIEYMELRFLQTKPARTIAGVAPVAIMTKPSKCPHGKCIMCPGGLDSEFGNTPQSYTGKEPAARRALRNFYNPYMQVFNRLEQYTLLNQSIDKVELIIMGGTFMAMDKDYRDSFVKYAFKAMNDFSERFYKDGILDFKKFKEFFELPSDVEDLGRTRRIQEKILALKKKCELEQEQLKNETAQVRCVALCMETRPDVCGKEEIDEMLRLGCTRVELGVQSTDDDVLLEIEREHTVADSIKATQLLRDSFFKIGYHIMPGLPKSSKEKDIGMFKELFSNQDFKPDMLKIYPCMVTKGTELFKEFKLGRFKPLTTDEASEIIKDGKKFVEPYCRIMRVQRDIPSKIIEAGVDITNLRQKIIHEMKKKRLACKCIRCREPKGKFDFENFQLKRLDYDANNGKEIFLSIEDKTGSTIFGFCRLRVPFKPYRLEIKEGDVGIRQIHVYTSSIGIGKEPGLKQAQHRGFGKLLMQEAEKIAKEELKASRILVLSGVGVKEYFRNKLDYKDEGAYLAKDL